MDVDFNRRKKDDGTKFRLFGVMSCKKCTEKWKAGLRHKKGRKVRVIKAEKGYEVWVSP